MPRIKFTGEPAQAPAGYAIWEPGEEREVAEDQAEELARNVNYVRVDGQAGPVIVPAPVAPGGPVSPGPQAEPQAAIEPAPVQGG